MAEHVDVRNGRDRIQILHEQTPFTKGCDWTGGDHCSPLNGRLEFPAWARVIVLSGAQASTARRETRWLRKGSGRGCRQAPPPSL
jgi:hypothetical protein